jgi:amidase
MTELWKLSAVDMAAGIRTRDFKPSEVVASAIARIEQSNPHLNAITIDLTEQAAAEARAADQVVAAGRDFGPFHGVPMTIKENVDVAGQPNTNGVPAFAEVVATEDSPLVRNLRHAGAIVIGRTNTPEFSMRGTTDNPLRGRTTRGRIRTRLVARQVAPDLPVRREWPRSITAMTSVARSGFQHSPTGSRR